MSQKRKPSIGFLTSDWAWGTDPLQPNGCSWYRCCLPARELIKHGWHVTIGFPGFNNKLGFGSIMQDGKSIHGFDLIVFKLLMQKEVLEAMPKAKELGQRIIVDVDDFFEGLDPSNRAHQTTDPKNNENSNREIYSQIIMSADAVITSTPFLFEYYGKKRPNVFMVRNGIDIERWTPKKVVTNHRLKLGWVGATPWRSNDLEQLSPFISDYLFSRRMSFHHSGHTENGAPRANRLLGIPDHISRMTKMAPILSYPKLFTPLDIGMVPLNDIPFNHAKSFIKGLEYAAAGIPFVSSYSPEYEYLAEQGIGRVAKTQDEWVYHLDELNRKITRIEEIEENLENIKKFGMDERGLDWDATFRFILERI